MKLISPTLVRAEYAVCGGRGAGQKTVVFGLLERGSSVYTEMVPNASKAILQAIIRGNAHVNGIESFWSCAKRRLVKFNGVPRHTFYLYLKKTEYRFNNRHGSVYKALLSLLNNHPL